MIKAPGVIYNFEKNKQKERQKSKNNQPTLILEEQFQEKRMDLFATLKEQSSNKKNNKNLKTINPP